jgi:hypothetical protein
MVIKPGTAPWVEPGPGRSRTWTGSGLLKDRLVRPMTRANSDETRFFFPFSNVVSVLHPPFLFHHLLYNELLLAAVERKGEWGTLSLEVGRAGLLCQWAAVLVWPRDGDGWERRRRGSLVLAKKPGGWLREGWGKLWPGSSSHAAWQNAF